MKYFNKFVILFMTLAFLTCVTTACSHTIDSSSTPASTDDGTKYTITFNSDGGSSVSQQKLKEGEKVTKPSAPVKKGYAFDGWFIEDEEYDFNNDVTSNLTLKAKWTKTYTVSFNTDGGNPITSIQVREGQKATAPVPPQKEGYSFIAWYYNDTAFNFTTTPINADIELKAKWSILTYLVTFDSDNGQNNTYQTIEVNNKVTKPETPTKTGYTFLGWYDSDNNEYDFSKPVTSDINLTAKWIDTNSTINIEEKVTAENIVTTIQNVVTSRTIKASGEFSYSDISLIKDALNTL